MSEQYANQMQQFSQAANALAAAYVRNLQPLFDAIREAGRAVYKASWQAYLEAGAPYGESHEGMMGWMQECISIARFEAEAEKIKQHHTLLADMRKRLSEPSRQP